MTFPKFQCRLPSRERRGCLHATIFVLHYLIQKGVQKLLFIETQRKKLHFSCHAVMHGTNLRRLPPISQLLLTQFWPNFKDRLLGTSRIDSNFHGVHATYVLTIFVHIRNMSVISDSIMTKILDTIIGAPIFLDQFCFVPNFFWQKLWPSYQYFFW